MVTAKSGEWPCPWIPLKRTPVVVVVIDDDDDAPPPPPPPPPPAADDDDDCGLPEYEAWFGDNDDDGLLFSSEPRAFSPLVPAAAPLPPSTDDAPPEAAPPEAEDDAIAAAADDDDEELSAWINEASVSFADALTILSPQRPRKPRAPRGSSRLIIDEDRLVNWARGSFELYAPAQGTSASVCESLGGASGPKRAHIAPATVIRIVDRIVTEGLHALRASAEAARMYQPVPASADTELLLAAAAMLRAP